MELTDTLEKVRDRFLEKSTEVELLQKKADDQVGRWRLKGGGVRPGAEQRS